MAVIMLMLAIAWIVRKGIGLGLSANPIGSERQDEGITLDPDRIGFVNGPDGC